MSLEVFSQAHIQQRLPLEQKESNDLSPQLQALVKKITHIVKHEVSFSLLIDIREHLKTISAKELHLLLQESAKATLEQEDSLKSAEMLASLCKPEMLQDAIRTEHRSFKNALITAKEMCDEAKCYLACRECHTPSQIKTHVDSLLDTCVEMIEKITTTFDMMAFFNRSENHLNSEQKLHTLLAIATTFLTLSILLSPLVGPLMVSFLCASALLLITATSFFYPHIKPTPQELPKATNWSTFAEIGKLPTSCHNQALIDEIASVLSTKGDLKRYPLIIGKTGVGKTETVKAFVHAVKNGLYPELKDKIIFYIHSQDVAQDPLTLSQLSKAAQHHREHIILIFDDLHLAFQNAQKTSFFEHLKKHLESATESFPYVIGIASEESFFQEISQKTPAVIRKFKLIRKESLTDSETSKVINKQLIKEAPYLLVEKESIRKLVDKTKEVFGQNCPQPASSLTLLSQCIQNTTHAYKSEIQKKVAILKDEFDTLILEITQNKALQPSFEEQQEKRSQMKKLKKKLQEMENKLEIEEKKLYDLFHFRNKMTDVKTKTFQMATKIAELTSQNAFKHPSSIASFLILSHYITPCFEKTLQKKTNDLQIPGVLDSSLIDRAAAQITRL